MYSINELAIYAHSLSKMKLHFAHLPLRLELFHDVQKVIVDLWLVAKLELDLIKVGESIFHFETLELRTSC